MQDKAQLREMENGPLGDLQSKARHASLHHGSTGNPGSAPVRACALGTRGQHQQFSAT